MVKHAKPKGFYDVFERKSQDFPAGETTHYCPGCGHGTVHKLIAEALVDMGLQDRTIFLSPVGCAVFGYYYFDTGNIQCAHGRAPAVGTGVARSLDDAVVISYQGDGDLAGIGTAEIVHAANRNENMAVFFVNNAIYGMTGGQMAPTTLLGQSTTTSPLGRKSEREGGPIHMAEVMSALEGPIYIERCTLSSPAGVMKTRKAVRKALTNQSEKRGFSFVEILSPCPVGWKMTPVQSRSWMASSMESVFPVKRFRDEEAAPKGNGRLPFLDDGALRDLVGAVANEVPTKVSTLSQDLGVKIAGFGGQGVMSAGILLANAAIHEGLHTTWLPSYGPEMRGGKANASVVLSSDAVGSPVVDVPQALLAMNGPSLDAFENHVVPGGLVMVNSSLISRKVERRDVRVFEAPVSDLAAEAGFLKGANIVMLALFALESGVIGIQTLKEIIPKSMKNKDLVEINLRLVDVAEEFHGRE
ncbi:MAG: 2-oxoacid:acceptor oxidoreductase family protein [Spirochaetales bacterium]|nr:2-oxoacid:acceptor oxidoreductase family protein [Spirochaetales bacterium]